MEYTVQLQDGADLELTNVGVAAENDQISFSIDGQIKDIDDDLMDVFSGKSLKPVVITFKVEENEE